MQKSRPPKTKFPILTLFKTVLFGWLVLLIWAIHGWVQRDFSQSINAIQTLATSQIELVSSFSQMSQILSFINELSIKSAILPHDLNPLLIVTIQIWTLLCAITHVFFIKLCIIAFSIPLFALAILAGLVDGLSQRAIRTANLGRESTYIFHKSIPVIKRIFIVLLLLWLSLPISLSPSPIFLSLALVIGLLISISASRFKKYL